MGLVQELLGLGQRQGEGLLHQDVAAGGEGASDECEVSLGRRADVHHRCVGLGEPRLVVADRARTGEAAMKLGDGCLVAVDERTDLGAGSTGILRVPAAHESAAQDGYPGAAQRSAASRRRQHASVS